MSLPTGLTSEEELCIRDISKELGLTFCSQEQYGKKIVRVSKRQHE
jgi:hypothetical protein